ncbi:MAG: hypothetical protein MGF17_02865 [Trichodesmium sp. MAG_R04]|nr:hypothetical protein [Trichodesmium sp. MAG_R04]
MKIAKTKKRNKKPGKVNLWNKLIIKDPIETIPAPEAEELRISQRKLDIS